MFSLSRQLFYRLTGLLFFVFFAHFTFAATIECTGTGGVWSSTATWVGGVVPTSADDVVIATTAGNSVVLDAPISIGSLTINFDAVLDAGTFQVTLSGNLAVIGTFTSTTGGLALDGTNNQNIAGFTTTGNLSMLKTGGTATLVGTVNAAQCVINGTGGTLNLGVNRTHNFTGGVVLTAGTLDGGSSTLNTSGAGTAAWTGTGSLFVPSTSTIVLSGVTQTVNTTTTFYNLTFGGTGSKTIAGSTTSTVNGTFLIANGTNANTFTGSLIYGASASLRYNVGTSNRTVGAEWPTIFTALGGVIIDGSSPGTITLNNAKQFGNNTNVSLTLNPGSILATANNGLTFHGDFINNGTLSAGSSNITISGTVSTQAIAGFVTTGTVTLGKTAGAATLSSNVSAGALTINGVGGTLNLGSSTHTVSGNVSITNGTLNANTSTLLLAGNLSVTTGTFNPGSFNLTLNGGNNQGVAGFTTTGNIVVNKSANTATLNGNISANNVTVSNNTLSLGTSLTHTISGVLSRTAGTLNFGTNTTINLTGTGTVLSGTIASGTNTTVALIGAAQTIGTANSFVNLTLGGSGAKTIAVATTITGILSIENGSTANSISGTITYSGTASLRYNAGSSNRTVGGEWTATAFAGTGGVVIGGTGTITLNGAKTLGNSTAVPLTINSGATLATANNALTFHGNFINSGTFTAGSSAITITGTLLTQSIAGYTTTGLTSMTKTAGVATFTGNVNGGGLTINGTGGTLNLGSGLTHVFTGTWTRTAGTLDGASSSVEFSAAGTVFSGTGGAFTAGTSTVVFSAGSAQSCPVISYNNLTLKGSGSKTFASTPTVNGILSLEETATVGTAITYGASATLRYNKAAGYTTTNNEFPASLTVRGGLVLAGAGTITLNAAKTLTFKVTLQTGSKINLGTFTHSCKGVIRGAGLAESGIFGGNTSAATTIDPTYFEDATGVLNSASPTATWDVNAPTTNWETNSNWLEGTKPDATTDVTIPAGPTQPELTTNAACKDLTINASATLTTAGFQLTLNGDFTNNGTATFSNSPIVIGGQFVQSIGSFTTTGTVTMTKTAGIATFTGNLSAAALTLNGSGGTLNLGTALNHSITGNITLTAGTLNGGSSTLNLEGNISGVGTFTGNAVNLVLTGTNAQSIPAITTTGNVSMTKASGTASLTGAMSAAALTINGGGTLSMGSATHTFSGDVTLTAGTLGGGSSTINVNASTTTAWTGTGSVFSAGTSTVVFGGVAQTINTTTTFFNLRLAGTGAKTFASGTTTTINGTHTISNGTVANVFTGATLAYGASAGILYNGAAARNAANEWPATFNATGGVTLSTSGTVITLVSARVLGENVPLTINTGATLTQGANLITLGGNFTNAGTFTNNGTGGVTLSGTANQSIATFTTAGALTITKTGGTATLAGNVSAVNWVMNGVGGTLNLGTGRSHIIRGDLTITAGTFTPNNANIELNGTTAQAIAGFTTTGNISMTKTGGVATFSGNVSAAALTMNGNGGTLNLGTSLSHTFSGVLTRTNGTLNGGTNTTLILTVSGAVVSGTGGSFVANTGTVNYAGTNQTVGALTYNNLTLSNSGVKTTSLSVVVNRILSLEGTATVSAPFTYGGESTLRYNKGASYTTTANEFPDLFQGSGGVILAGTGVIQLNAAKTILGPLAIQSGAKMDLNTFTGHSSKGLTLAGVAQAVGIYGGSSSAAANVNDTYFEATSTGTITVANSQVIWLGLSTNWFDPANWQGGEVPSATLDVSIPNGTPNYPLLTANAACGDLVIALGGSLNTAGFQLSLNGDFTNSGTVTWGSSNIELAGIYNQNIATITTTGSVLFTKTAGTATMLGNLNIGTLNLNGSASATLSLGTALTHTFNGDITIVSGILTYNNAAVVFSGTANQNIAALTTTGNVSMTKTGGTATLAGNLSAAAIVINGSGGTLNLGAGFSHTISGNITLTAGTLNGGSSTLNIAGNISGAATFTGNACNITFSGTGNQSIGGFTTTGSLSMIKTGGTATFTGNVSVNALTLNGTGGTLNFGTGLTHTFTGNITVTAGTLTANTANITLAGTNSQSIPAFTTTGNILVTKTGGTATFIGNVSANALTLNGVGGTLSLGAGLSHTFSGNIAVTAGTLNGASANVTLSGTTAQSVAGFTTTGTISMTKTGGGVATFTGNINAGGLTLNGLGGTLNLGNALTHTFTGTWTRSNGTLDGGTSTIIFTALGNFISGSIGSFVSNGGTVNYGGSGDQTIGSFTYNNLTLSGSGIKTNTAVSVNGVFSLEGSATITSALTYGSSATLRYNKPSAYTTTDNEFPPAFVASGGVIINGAGTIILNNDKTISGTLTIGNGSVLDLNGLSGHVTNGLNFGTTIQSTIGTYGTSASLATNTNDVYFVGTGTLLLNITTTTWLGSTPDWFDPLNWSNGIPSSFVDAVIESSVPLQPVLIGFNAEARDLTINSGASLTTAGRQLTLYGNFVRNGSVNFSSSPIVITGTANQTIANFTTTGMFSMTKLGGVATITGNLSTGGITVNGAGGTLNLGSGFTHTISGDLIVSAGTLQLNSSNVVVAGTAEQSLAGFTTTGSVSVTKTGGTATLSGNLSAASLTLNGVGGTLNLGAGNTHTINGNITLTNGTLNGESSTLIFSGNLSGSGTFTGNACNLSIVGTTAQNIVGFTTTGNISMTKTGGTATFTGNVSANELVLNGVGGTLDLGTGRTHTFSGDITLSNGTLNASSSTLNANASTATAWNGNGALFNAGTGSVAFGGAAQTIGTSTTFNNLILSGTGSKTFTPGITITVNGTHTIANGNNSNDFTGVTLNYGAAAGIRYNVGTASRTVQAEWPATFTGTGGIVIDGTGPGAITLNGAKQIGNNTTTPLTINAGGSLVTSGFGLTLHAAFTNAGTITAGSSSIVIGGNLGSQNIAGFTTTGGVTFNKSSGAATFTGNISASSLTVNASGATLNLGTGRTHAISGDVSLTAGTLNAGSSTLNISAASATAWNGTGSNFTSSTGTVIFSGASPTIATPTTFNNLTCSGTGTVVFPSSLTINGALVTNQAINTTTNTTLITLSGGSAQTLSGSVRPSFQGLTVNNTAGVSFSYSPIVLGTLTLTAGTINIGSDSLTLGGSISRTSGTINATNGKVRLAGGSAQSIPANLFTSNTVRDLTLANSSGATLGGNLLLTGVFTPVSGTLAAGNNLTLVSNAGGTARIANGNCTSCTYISGNVRVQRFIPSSARRWRFLGSNVAGATINDWKAETFITGNGGAANGFDATLSNQASVFSYNESATGDLNQGWVAPTNINNTMEIGKGYRLFVRGDRSNPGRLDGSVTTQNEVTLDLAGTPNQGDVVMPVTYTTNSTNANDGWNFVSNPYPSPYDWQAHYSNGGFHSNIEPTIWIMDANSNSYISYNAALADGLLTNGIIPSGAGFWVKATGSSPSLVFKEQFKSGATPVSLFKTAENSLFTIKMQLDSITYDQTQVKYFTESTNKFDAFDIRKLNGQVNISSWGEDSVRLSLNARPLNTETNDTIRLHISGQAGTYKMIFNNSDQIAVQEELMLFDTYAGTVTDLQRIPEYEFSIVNSIPATQGFNRFYIVVASPDALPVTLLSFHAAPAKDQQSVKATWHTGEESNSSHFDIERSEDGNTFRKIGTVKAAGNSSSILRYSFVDAQPNKRNYYRLKQVDLDGSFEYSRSVFVGLDGYEQSQLILYPVPAKEEITVSIGSSTGIVSYEVYNIEGKKMLEGTCSEELKYTVSVQQLPSGMYMMMVTDAFGAIHKQKFVKE